MNIEVIKYKRISDIPEHIWNQLSRDSHPAHDYYFLKAVDESGVENAENIFLLFYKQGKLIGNAVISTFYIHLDLFIKQSKLMKTIKSLSPRFFQVKIVVCGIPASFGQHNICCDENNRKAIISLLHQRMTDIARKNKVGYLFFKEFNPNQSKKYASLLDCGYFKAYSIPNMVLNIRWSSFEEYFQSLRHDYRRRILTSLHKIGLEKPKIYNATDSDIPLQNPAIIHGSKKLCSPEQFHRLYMAVMDRTTTKLETLNKYFFDQIYQNFGNNLELLVLKNGSHIISVAWLIKKNKTMHFMLIGKRDRRDAFDSYFNMLYAILSEAMESGFTTLYLGQTSYQSKYQIGALPEDRFFYMKCINPVKHQVVKLCNGLMFPKLPDAQFRVFKETAN